MSQEVKKYANIREYTEDVVIPLLIAIRNYLEANMDDLNSDLSRQIADLEAALTAHIQNKENPHETKPRHIFTISNVKPTPTDGEVGDMWVEILPNVIT